MKSIMISIKPEWVEKILNNEKTIEIRKSCPKCDLPCKVYIYCSKSKSTALNNHNGNIFTSTPNWQTYSEINGKVVAEFTLNTIEKYGWMHAPLLFIDGYMRVSENNLPEKGLNYNACCITKKEIADYADDGGILPAPVFAWYINDLKIYDKPKELSEFGVKRAFQSWGYINGKK